MIFGVDPSQISTGMDPSDPFYKFQDPYGYTRNPNPQPSPWGNPDQGPGGMTGKIPGPGDILIGGGSGPIVPDPGGATTMPMKPPPIIDFPLPGGQPPILSPAPAPSPAPPVSTPGPIARRRMPLQPPPPNLISDPGMQPSQPMNPPTVRTGAFGRPGVTDPGYMDYLQRTDPSFAAWVSQSMRARGLDPNNPEDRNAYMGGSAQLTSQAGPYTMMPSLVDLIRASGGR